jgi:hypothetical protein
MSGDYPRTGGRRLERAFVLWSWMRLLAIRKASIGCVYRLPLTGAQTPPDSAQHRWTMNHLLTDSKHRQIYF